MHRMRMSGAGNDGTQEYAAGDVIDTALDHARRALVRGTGALLDENDRKVPLAKAILELRLPEDDVVAIETTDKTVLAMQAKIESQRQED